MLENETETAPAAEREVTPAPQTPEGSTEQPQDGAQRPEGEEALAGEAEAAAEPQPEPKPAKAPQSKWMQDRINEVTKQKHDEARRAAAAEARAAELEAQIERLRRGEVEPELRSTERVPEQDDKILEAKAQALVAEREFARQCNALIDTGEKEYPDFQETLQTFQLLGGLDRGVVESAVDAGNPHKILYYLGNNPEEYKKISAMPERQQGAAIARLADKLSAPPAPKAISKAPPPIAPVSGQGRTNVTPENETMDEFNARRTREIAERYGR